MFVEFEVPGKPPKKDGANSMWKKESEAQNIINLRKEARKAVKQIGVDLFSGPLGIELTIYARINEIEGIGDLDNFITGICDGLQKAHPNVLRYINKRILKECNPHQSIFVVDDAKVYDIRARKVPFDGEMYYRLKVFEIDSLPHHE